LEWKAVVGMEGCGWNGRAEMEWKVKDN